jgi:HPt (histidine-containing phosphotransfer) domain-containing protein
LFPEWTAPVETAAIATEGNTSPVASGHDANGAPVLDAAVLRDLKDIAGPASDQFLNRIFSLYRENAPRAGNELVRAAGAGDHDACAKAAHALKSMSQNVGARAVAQAAERIERHCRENANVPDAERVLTLTDLLEKTMAAIAAQSAERAASDNRKRA